MFYVGKPSLSFNAPAFFRRAVAVATFTLGFGLTVAFGKAAEPAAAEGGAAERAMNRAIESEHSLLDSLRQMHPVVETYIQEQRPDPERGSVPSKDHYFLGRLDLSRGVTEESYIPAPSFRKRLQHFKPLSLSLNMNGWAHFALLDYDSFDREHYKFAYVRREFLGGVRCFVFNAEPRPNSGRDRFKGRLWVEDQGYHIVRFNGTYGPTARGSYWVHFDSWRINVAPEMWLPGCSYAEESGLRVGISGKFRFKAQVRYWGYQLQARANESEYTSVTVDPQSEAKDITATTIGNSSVTALRLWERQAEDNVLDRLERGGFLAPKGEVDRVLETVVNNVEVTNELNIQPEVRVRVLLTTPLEAFTVGHTIVVSRGLLDVLPDEASLAAILAHELAHITLGHQTDTKFAFTDRLLFDDKETLKRVSFVRSIREENEADAKAVEYLQKSPYAAKLIQTGLFLRQLSAYANRLPDLIRPLLGDRVAGTHDKRTKDLRLSGLMEVAPPLREGDTAQVAALPLGSRIKLDPWSDQLTLMKAPKMAILSPKEKLPFEVTPFMLNLSRISHPEAVTAGAASSGVATKSAFETAEP